MKKKILFITLFFTCLSAIYAQQVNLVFNPAKGKTYQYTYEANQNITQEMFGNKIDTKQKMVFVFDAEVLEKKNNNIKMGYTYTDVLFEMVNNQINLKYKYNEPVDDNPFAQLIGKMYNAMIGHPFEVTHAPDGSVTQVSGIDTIVESIKSSLNDGSEIGQNIGAMLDSFFNEKMMTEMFESSMKVYPDKKIRVGESWEANRHLTSTFNMDVYSIYTLESVNKNTANVSIRSTIKSEIMEGEQTGTITYNLKSGMPQTTNMQQTLKSVEGQAPMSIVSDVKVTVE